MELLNGKAKELFEQWVINNPSGHDSQRMVKRYNQKELFVSYVGIGKTLLNALIIEWFDSVGITVDVMPILDEKVKFQPNTFWLEKEIITEEIEYFETRQEATTEAIKKAVELINKDNEQSR